MRPSTAQGLFSLWGLFPLLGLLVLADGLLAREAAVKGKRFAVVVGVSTYRKNQGLSDLPHAGHDAVRLSEVLRDGGYKVTEMTHEVARQPAKEQLAPSADYIRDQLDVLVAHPTLGDDDTVLVSLHGHGIQMNFVEKDGKKTPRLYFCPADAAGIDQLESANNITERNHLLSLDEVYEKLQACKAATRLLIVDACRNDPTRIEGLRESDYKSLTMPVLPTPPGGIAAFFSCRERQRAIEDPVLKHGVFTHFLIEGLQGKADLPTATKPADGVVTLAELSAYVSGNTFEYVQDKFNRKQSPAIRGEFDGNTPLLRIGGGAGALPKTFRSTASGIEFVLIPAGEFDMGSNAADVDKLAQDFGEFWKKNLDNEQPKHRVKISQPFYLGKFEVTKGQFARFIADDNYMTDSERDGRGGSGYDTTAHKLEGRKPQYTWKFVGWNPYDDNHPVVNVTWNDARAFCTWLSRKEGKTYRLPTEAEWEYACRAGTTTLHPAGNQSVELIKIANIADQSAKRFLESNLLSYANHDDHHTFTAPVGVFQANGFGLHDTIGNVYEWCEDMNDVKAYVERSRLTVDPHVVNGSYPVFRGGSWKSDPAFTRSAKRGNQNKDTARCDAGFRVVLSAVPFKP